jgi:hypothetical protein
MDKDPTKSYSDGIRRCMYCWTKCTENQDDHIEK